MTTATDAEGLMTSFERRTALLAEVLELTQRQRRCLEQGRTQRLDRLIGRREHALRQWRQLEQELGPELEQAQAGMLSTEQKARLRALLSESDDLVTAIVREEDGLGKAIGVHKAALTDELKKVRKERAALRAYAGRLVGPERPGVDRSA